jgi:hypothetical protein
MMTVSARTFLVLNGSLPDRDIRAICPRCLGHEAIHPRHPWDCDITPEEWREFYAAPWPALYMVRYCHNRQRLEGWR